MNSNKNMNTSGLRRWLASALVVGGLALAGGYLWTRGASSESSLNEQNSSADTEPSGISNHDVAAKGTSSEAIQTGQTGSVRNPSPSQTGTRRETADLESARRTMAVEMEHALTTDPASEKLKLQALKSSGDIQIRLKAIAELETAKPRGFVNALLAISNSDEMLVKHAAVGALGHSYFPEALQRLNVMVQDKVQHPTVREGVLLAMTSLAKAASEQSLYPSSSSTNEAIIAETRTVLLKQLDTAAKLRDGSEMKTTIQILEALSYLKCPELVVIIHAKLRESYGDFSERNALVVALGRSGFVEAQTVLEEYQAQLEERLAASATANPMIQQTVRSSLALVQETLKNLRVRN